MDIESSIKGLDFDIKQIDYTIEILDYLTKLNVLSPNGLELLHTNISNLGQVQHNLLQLRSDFSRQQNQQSKSI